ncbi:MAG: DUF4160 domain-containing protein [Desulfovibrionaceae bacterium]|nr:DUF4160 domain-containing protein [Desulfovibrionaceae bacterium]MBF0512757.1 DUF4160 domain-containing protein [Desulfovibrionaceae bacterium]
MPTICRFYGIVILMNFLESGRRFPHFHARYGKFRASFSLDPLACVAGKLPPRAERLVLEWADMHNAELLENYERATRAASLAPIAPLP